MFFYGNDLISAKNINFYEFCENDARFQKGDVISANSAKKAAFSERGRHLCEFCEKDARFPRGEFVDFPKMY